MGYGGVHRTCANVPIPLGVLSRALSAPMQRQVNVLDDTVKRSKATQVHGRDVFTEGHHLDQGLITGICSLEQRM